MELRVHRSLGVAQQLKMDAQTALAPAVELWIQQEFRSGSTAEDEAQTALPRVQEGVEDRADWDLWNSSNSGA